MYVCEDCQSRVSRLREHVSRTHSHHIHTKHSAYTLHNQIHPSLIKWIVASEWVHVVLLFFDFVVVFFCLLCAASSCCVRHLPSSSIFFVFFTSPSNDVYVWHAQLCVRWMCVCLVELFILFKVTVQLNRIEKWWFELRSRNCLLECLCVQSVGRYPIQNECVCSFIARRTIIRRGCGITNSERLPVWFYCLRCCCRRPSSTTSCKLNGMAPLAERTSFYSPRFHMWCKQMDFDAIQNERFFCSFINPTTHYCSGINRWKISVTSLPNFDNGINSPAQSCHCPVSSFKGHKTYLARMLDEF